MTKDKKFKSHDNATGHLSNLLPATTVTYRQMQREVSRISLYKKFMPVFTVIIFSALVLWPVINSKEGSFTLAIDRLDERDENAKLTKPRYVGIDKYNNPVNISAETAFRKNNDDKDYYLKNLLALMSMRDGTAIKVEASSGMLDAKAQEITLDGKINIVTDNDFSLTTEQAVFLINEKIATGENGVAGKVPFGTFKADKFHVDVDQEIIRLKKHVKLHFDPEKQINLSKPETE
ncbi:MAG: LPS export ABC transporter periplasmic protein LptC [Emcibacter sp.]|nr:LPS export ABC transporter periplasmic protein LptC [Emcibacter sp.]